MITNPINETNFPPKLLLTKRQVANFQKNFANNLPTHKLSKTQLSKVIQSGGFLGRQLSLKTGLPLMKNSIKPLATSVIIPI